MGENSRTVEAEANDVAYGKLHISVTNGLVSIQATEVTLQEILEEIARIASIQIHGTISSKKTVTISVDRLTVEEAVRYLAKNTIIIYQEKLNHSVPEISEIIVLPDSTDIGSLGNELATSNRAIDTTTERGQPLIDLPGPPPLAPPPAPPP